MDDIFTDNLIAPLVLPDGEIDRFIQAHRCGECLLTLMKRPAPGRKWYVDCVDHGHMTKASVVSASAAERVESDNYFAMRELTR